MKTTIYLLCGLAFLVQLTTIPACAGTYVIDQQVTTVIHDTVQFFGNNLKFGQEFVPTLGSITGADFSIGISGPGSFFFTLSVKHSNLDGSLNGPTLGGALGAIEPGGIVHFDLPLIPLTTGPCTTVDLTGCYVLVVSETTLGFASFDVEDDSGGAHTPGNRAITGGLAQSYSFVFSEGTSAAPEPSTWVFLVLGVGTLVRRRMRLCDILQSPVRAGIRRCKEVQR